MPKIDRRALWSGLALSAASAAILISAPAQYLGRQQDDLLYIIGAHSLAHGSFRLLTSPGSPPLAMINPGFPLLLLPLVRLAGENFPIYQAFCALLLAASPWILWYWLRRRLDWLDSLLIALLFASSPLVLSQAGAVMSETPFLLLTLALLIVLDKPSASPYAAGGLLLAITQVRSAGLFLVPAALAKPIKERRWARALAVAALPTAGMLAFSAWSYRAAGSVQKFQEFGLSSRAGLGQLAGGALENARYYLSAWGSSCLPAALGEGAAALALGALLTLAGAAGAWRLLRRDPCEPGVWALAFTAALHTVWPWHYDRYLIMPLPLLLWTLSRGLGSMATPALGLLLAGQILFQTPKWLGGTSWSAPELAETYAWLKSHSGQADILSSALYVRDGFHAGRPSLPLADAPDAAGFAAALKRERVRLILWQDGQDLGLSRARTSAIKAKVLRAGRHLQDGRFFRLIYGNANEKSRVYELR